MIYQHPLAYLLGMEGLALLRAWAGDFDQAFVTARLAEVRRLLDDEAIAGHEGVLVERGATTNAYRQWAGTYDESGNGLFDLDQPMVVETVDALPIGTALDAACGTGRLTTHLVERGHRVIGVDASPDMLEQARRLLPSASFALGDLRRLPLADDSMDFAVNGLALTHVDALEPVLAEFARVLRPNGHLIISDVHPELVLRGSVVTAVGPAQQPQMAATYRHTVSDFLRAALGAGFLVRRFDEQPRPEASDEPAAKPSDDIGSWQDWPWTLLGVVPEASRAAWDKPAVVLWHLQLG
jgi:ubiquinone/menaquinone biosynthesis C-methylase UbiE